METRRRRVHLLHNPITALVILFCGLAATLSAWRYSAQALEIRTQERFQGMTSELQHAIYERMILYEQVLWGGAALFSVSEDVTRDEWRRYVDTLRIEQRWPGIQGMGFSIPLRPEEVAPTIAAVRAEGFPEFSIRPEGDRDEYSTIIYLEPFNWRNQRAFGYDMWSNEMRREAMMLARDTGNAATSGIITLVQETDDDVQSGFLTYIPVYKEDVFMGWVYAAFRMGDLMAGTLGVGSDLLTYEIYDGVSLTEEALLYDSDAPRDGDTATTEALQKTVPIYIQGRTWTIVFRTSEDFISRTERAQPFLVAVIGILIDLLLFYVLIALVSLNRHATSIAEKQTVELEVKNTRLEESDEHNQRLLGIINRSKDFIAYTDANGKFVFINESLRAIIGQKTNTSKLDIHDLHPAEFANIIETEGIPTALREGFWRGETSLITQNGQTIPVDQLILTHFDSSGVLTHTSTVMRDMSSQRSMEHDLRTSNEELLRFAFVASHDLQEPLRKIISFSDLLKRELEGTLSEDSELYLGYLIDSAQRMRQLIRDLLIYSRVSQQEIPFEDCSSQAALDLVLNDLEDSRELVTYEPLPDLLFKENLLVQLFQNLIGNGLKYQPSGQTAAMHVSAQRTDSGWTFAVRDNGIGIAPRYHQQIFEPFKRLHNRTTYSGTGIGLAICKRIVERRGGTLWIESDPTKEGEPAGCTFLFTVPDALPGE